MKLKLILIFFLLTGTLFSQVDSLIGVYKKTKADTSKINLINRIVYDFEQTNLDSAKSWANKGLALSQKTNYNKGIGQYYNHKGRLNLYTQKYDSAIAYFKKAYPFFEKAGFTKGMISCNNNIGAVYAEIGNNKQALEYHFKNIEIALKVGEEESLANSYVNVGNVYNQQQNYLLSVKSILKAIPIYEKLKSDKSLGTCYYNLAVSNFYLKNYKIASEYGLKSNEYLLKANAHSQLPLNYSLLSNIEEAQKNYAKAIVAGKTGVDLALKQSNQYALFFLYINISQASRNLKELDSALLYANKAVDIAIQFDYDVFKLKSYFAKGVALNDRKDYKTAILFLDTALTLSKEQKDMAMQTDCNNYLALCYKALSQHAIAYDYFVEAFLLKDTIFENSNSRSILELQTLFETEKKELQIKNQSLQIESGQKENESKNRLLIFAVIGLCCIAVFAGIASVNYRRTKKANVLIQEQKQQVELKNGEITQQKLIVDQKQKEIIDSITYAKRIQQAMLPPAEFVNKHIPENFILYKPKDIVAGDFYWAEFAEDLFFIAAADSTGHGVPGAMVSVVCNSALNRSVKEFKITEPGKILDKTKELVLETFAKSGDDVKDGMDISLLAIDAKNKKIWWSGANNPLWYIQDNQFIEIKGDKQPVGKTDLLKPFTTHEISYKENTLFYLFTDGYPDQFGGPNGKKYKYNRFAELIISNSSENIKTQCNTLDSTFNAWKKNQEQTDDVCIIGLKI